jgi:hypothetical protein
MITLLKKKVMWAKKATDFPSQKKGYVAQNYGKYLGTRILKKNKVIPK